MESRLSAEALVCQVKIVLMGISFQLGTARNAAIKPSLSVMEISHTAAIHLTHRAISVVNYTGILFLQGHFVLT